MSARITRRRLAAAVLVPMAGLAQNPPAAPPATPEAELNAARDRLKAVSEALAKQQVPMAIEPATQFRA